MDFKAVAYAKRALRGKKNGSTRKSEAEQHKLVCDWQKSGQTQGAFCQSHGVNPKTFSNWLRAYKSRPQVKENELPLSSLDECVALSTLMLEMVLPSGMVIRLQNAISDKQFSLLLKEVCQCN